MNLSTNIIQDRSGAALVEFSILLPLLFGLCFGLIEFGRATYQHTVAEKGVKAAARYIARAPSPDPCNPTASPAYATALTDAKNIAQKGKINGGTASLSNWTNASDISIAIGTISNAAANGGARPWRGQCDNLYVVTVSTSFAYNDLGLLDALGGLFNNEDMSSLTIRASHQEIFIGD